MTAIELDFGFEPLPAGGGRHLASENEFELLTEYFWTSVWFAVGGEVVFSAELTLLNFVEMVAVSARAVADGRMAHVSPEFGGAGSWSVVPARDRVRVEYRRYLPEEKRDVTGSVSAGRAELASAMGAFALRGLEAAERVDAAVAQNPWTRRVREFTREVLDRELDRSIVAVGVNAGQAGGGSGDGVDVDGLRTRLAYRLWSYGGLPGPVPAPVMIDVLVDADAGDGEAGAALAEGRPRVDAIVAPGVAFDADALAEAVWPGFGELLALYGATGTPLYRGIRRP